VPPHQERPKPPINQMIGGLGRDPLSAPGDEWPRRDRKVGAGHYRGDQGLEQAATGKRIARAPRKAPGQMQRNARIVHRDHVKVPTVGFDQGRKDLADHADELVLRRRHGEFRR